MKIQRELHRNGVYLDETFGPRRPMPLKHKLLVGMVYVGMLASLLLFAAGLLAGVWALGMVSRELMRWMGS